MTEKGHGRNDPWQPAGRKVLSPFADEILLSTTALPPFVRI